MSPANPRILYPRRSVPDLYTLQVLSKSFESDDPLQPVKAIRTVRHDDVEKQLFLAQKMASLRSGARGLQARKELRSAEARLEASLEL